MSSSADGWCCSLHVSGTTTKVQLTYPQPPCAVQHCQKQHQISGVEECLQELLADRARSLKAMENLTMQLRRRETDAEKLVHDNKALAARLELGEQEKASLETRARAAAEEHRVDRGRWVAHKQVGERGGQ